MTENCTSFIVAFGLCLMPIMGFAQDQLVVERCDAIDQSSPIQNIWVDDDGQKWIANDDGLFIVHACDLATPADLKPGESSILQIPDGNAELIWSNADLEQIVGGLMYEGDFFTTAYYRSQNDELWLGTQESGLFLLQTKPRLSLRENFTTSNSKLKSDYIHTIAFDESGRQFIGTEDGVLVGRNQRWTLEERYFRFQAMAVQGRKMWLLSEDMIWIVDERDNFEAAPIDPDMVSGPIKDIAFDTSGRLWIASEYLTWYDPISFDYKVFDGADYFTSSYVNCIAVDDGGAVWVGTDDKGLYLIQEASAMTVTCLLEKPLSCEGNVDDAQLVVKVNGGEPPYRYVWDKGFSGGEPDGLAAGSYTVTVTDSKGKFEVGQGFVPNPRMSLTIDAVTAATHGGNADGSAQVNIEGGVPEYKYSWDNGESTAKATKLSAGEHSVMVIDDNGCRADAKVTIEESVGELLVSLRQTAMSNCSGEQGNEIEALIEGGVKPYQSSWSSPNLRGSKLSGLAPGFYAITVSDQNGSESSASLTIPEPETFEVVTRVLKPASTNLSDGHAIARLRGGHEPFKYQWSNGATTKTVENLPAGFHNVVVTDSLGCEASASIEVTEDIQALALDVLTKEDNPCFAAEEGSISLDIAGGKPPYEISWNQPDLSSERLQGLVAGTYSVTVTDQSGLSQSKTIVISQPEEFKGELGIETAATMDSTDGSASVSISGGTPPIQYAWDNGETDRIAKRLSSGEHSVTVTDGNGCSFILTGSLGENVSPVAVTHSIEAPIECFGEKTGEVIVTGRGGRPPYSYVWSDSTLEGDRLTNLAAGYYEVTVTDSEGNTNETGFLLQEPLAPNIEVDLLKPASMGNDDGSAIVRLNDTAENYQIVWDDGSTAATAANLSKGMHTVTITDARGCVTEREINITEDLPTLQASVQVTKTLNCYGDDYAALEISVSGGSGNYTYLLNGGSVPARIINGLKAGEYEVGVRDSAEQEYTTSIVIGEPPKLTAEIEVLEAATIGEANGTARVNVEGGRGPYDFSWSNGFDRQMGSGFAAGKYEVLVVDALGCSTTAEVEITEAILPLRVDLTLDNENKCSDGAEASITSAIKGGKGPYRYLWSNGQTSSTLEGLKAGSYQVTVVDALGSSITDTLEVPTWEGLSVSVNPTMAPNEDGTGSAEVVVAGGFAPYSYKWSNGDVRTTAAGLAPGKYTVEVRDSRACRDTAEFEIEAAASALIASIDLETPINCVGAKGALSLNIRGGREPYSIDWSTGSSEVNLTDLSTGEYSVTITDAEGNTATKNYTLPEPEPFQLTVEQVQPASTDGSDGKAMATTTGGAGSINFTWSNGADGATASNLSAGTYQVTATDANGCETSGEVEVVEDIQALVIDLEVTQIPCAGQNTGSASIEVSGGKGPYNIEWSNQTSELQVENLPPGDHEVKVTDAIGNTKVSQILIQAPPVLDLGMVDLKAASTNQEDGAISTRVSGGVAPYTYAWNNGSTESNLTGIGPGLYVLTVTDANGCTDTEDIEVSENILALNATITTTEISCVSGSDGSAELTLSGGKPPYSIKWSTGGEDLSVSNLSAGKYQVTITDAASNEVTKSTTLNDGAELTLDVQQDSPASTGGKDGIAQAKVEGGTAPYTYAWSSGTAEATATELAPGDYTITVTDDKGCTAAGEVKILEDIQSLQLALAVEQISCAGEDDGKATLAIEGGKGPYQINWSNNESNTEVAGLAPGEYTVEVSDVLGTKQTESFTIESLQPLEVEIVDVKPASTNNSDGSASAVIKGGQAPYEINWNNGAKTDLVANLAPGDYQVTVKDANSCEAIAEVTITENILALEASISLTAVTCAGETDGAAQITTSGGKPPYVIKWSNGEESSSIDGLAAGQYEAIVTDAAGNEETLQAIIADPDKLALDIRQESPAATGSADGVAVANVSGGNAPYTYSWSTGTDTQTADGLAPGEYSLTVTDNQGCTTSKSITIAEDIKPLSVQLVLDKDIKCFGDSTGAAHVEISGGKGPFTVTWNQEELFGDDLTDLKAGTYEAKVVDESGQEQLASLTIDQPDELVVSLVDLRPSTDRSTSDGKAKVTVTGGTPPYTILWSNGSTENEVNALEVGMHSVKVVDANGCTVEVEFETKEKILPDLTAGKLRSGQVVKMEQLYFEADATQLNASSQPVLIELFEFLKDNPEIVVQMEGHTNSTPAHSWCDSVSTERARVVAQDLVDRGISGKRVFYKGFGKRKPLFSNDTAEGRRKNQRVEIRILRLRDD